MDIHTYRMLQSTLFKNTARFQVKGSIDFNLPTGFSHMYAIYIGICTVSEYSLDVCDEGTGYLRRTGWTQSFSHTKIQPFKYKDSGWMCKGNIIFEDTFSKNRLGRTYLQTHRSED